MGAEARIFEHLRRNLIGTVAVRRKFAPESTQYRELTRHIDLYLELWYDSQYLATEYDAKQWGFSEKWMYRLRAQVYGNTPVHKGRDGRWYAHA